MRQELISLLVNTVFADKVYADKKVQEYMYIHLKTISAVCLLLSLPQGKAPHSIKFVKVLCFDNINTFLQCSGK